MQNERKKKLLKVFEHVEGLSEIIAPMVDDVVFLEARLEELRTLPFIRVNPSNPAEQKATPAGKQYKELLQQYNNCIKILCSVLNRSEGEDESPLREWIKSERKKNG